MKRRNGGFTLVEMLATLTCTTLVTMAAFSFLLVCFRMCASATGTARDQDTSRIVLTLMDNIATQGQLTPKSAGTAGGDIVMYNDDTGAGGTKTVMFYYSKSAKTIYTGGNYNEAEKKYTGGTALMDGVEDFEAKLDPDTKLLTVTVTTASGTFKSCKYCRTAKVESTGGSGEPSSQSLNPALLGGMTATFSTKAAALPQIGNAEWAGRLSLITNLSLQDGSTGEIIGDKQGRYFSEWYIGGYSQANGWNKNTPWCACFASWGIAQVRDSLVKVVSFADVDSGVMRFRDGTFGSWVERDGLPIPGDLIFFDWDADPTPDYKDAAEHVGVVCRIENGRVYTIEGNSNGRVAQRSYPLDDPCILGYGRLEWKSSAKKA